jgi:hypothetical protein
MSPLTASYRHSTFTAEPERLSTLEIWAVARAVRGQMAAPLHRRLALDDIAACVARAEVNGVAFDIDWDFEHEVLSPAGQPVMGVTEYDRASPECVMVSINGPALNVHENLLRSTIAHELGHVVFDAPAWVTTTPAGCAFLSPDTAPGHGARGARDPREQRANEFMGALLVPPALLRVDVQRHAKKARFAPSPHPSRIIRGAPAYDACAQDADALGETVFALAELYGVSESFMRVRLARYDLLRARRLPTHSSSSNA